MIELIGHHPGVNVSPACRQERVAFVDGGFLTQEVAGLLRFGDGLGNRVLDVKVQLVVLFVVSISH